jgi:uncharacterized protein YoxC
MINLIPFLSFGLNIIILVVSIAGFLKILRNDLTHVQKSLDKIEHTINDMDKRIDNIGERVAKIEGRLK